MFSQFIYRPVLSIVLSLIITLLGVLAISKLPMTQFPSIAPPEVNVTTEFTGANAETSMKAVVTPLERAINGVPGMKYMSSDAGNDGVSVVQVLFEIGTDPDVAAVNVQNRVAAVMAELPSEVIKNGVKIAKEENSMLMYLIVYSKDSTLDEKFLYNFVDINVLAELKRIKGVGFADILGAREYAMRIWLKPDRMLAYNISTEEIIEELQDQNIEAAPGKVGESSDKKSQALQYVLKYTGRYNTKEEYGNIVIRSNEDGEMLRIKDIADVEFGTTYFDVISKFNGQSSAAIMIKQLPGSNASKVISDIKEKMAQLKKTSFSPGMDYEMSYDVSRFLNASIHEVIRTLIEAFLLVALVVFLFLQDFRSTLIPAIAVPVSLIGTFFFMQLFGFSINLITLFALVLAIGIVVDDAIVVVEAVHAKMQKEKLDPLTATVFAMKEISGAILAITLVMTAVFVPVMFMSGPVGIFFRQFAATMAIAIVISAVNALTLSPALCAIILKDTHGVEENNGPMGRFFTGFNSYYDKLSARYQRLLSVIANRRVITFGILGLFCIGTWGLSGVLPSGFIPNEDQGTFYASITTPAGSTLERTAAVVNQIQTAASTIPEIESVSSLAGINVLSDGTGATYGTCLINLKDWNDRKFSVNQISELLTEKTSQIKDARIEYFPPPAVPGYGNASGFELRLLDKTGTSDLKQLEIVTQKFMKDLTDRPEIENAFTIFDASFPQYLLHVDKDKAAQKGVSVGRAMGTLQTLIGSEYATNFIRFGQMYKVMVQASPEYRALPEDILKLYVKNKKGEMVPYSSFLHIERVYGIEQATRYNMYLSAELNGEPSPGYSSGSAIKAIQEVAAEKLPRGYEIDWAGISRDEVLAGNEAIYIFLICLLFVYLVLSAQYESFLLPLPVVLSLPTGIFGAFFFLSILGLENNIYAQIALIMLIGLLGKNAILIVEFAILKQKEGSSPFEAAIEAATIRLRPILMTSFAFIAGLIPLLFANGAGEIGNRTIGTAAAGGMLFGTVFGIIVIPGLYVVFATIALRFARKPSKNVKSPKFNTAIAGMLLLSCLLFSCKTSKPKADAFIPKTIPAWYGEKNDSVNSPTIQWRKYFRDTILVGLIDTALQNNLNALMALQRIEAARANIRFTQGALLPSVSAYASAAQRRFGLYTMDGAGNISTEITPGQIVPIHLKDFYLGLQTSWEIDLWGKLRNRKKAAIARYLAGVEGKNLVITNLIAEISNSYYDLLAQDIELDILQETIKLQEDAFSIVQTQKRAGVVNELAVEQFEAQLLNSKAIEKEILQLRIETENRINFFLGRYPQQIQRDKSSFLLPVPFQAGLGIPSDLLRNRPDIRQAELLLTAAKADLKSARASFYPSLNISGSYGLQAFNTNFLFTTPQSIAYSLLGGLTAPLINRSAIKSAFRYSNATQREALYGYQQTIMNGYVEVYNEMYRIRNLEDIQNFRSNQVTILTRSIETSTVLFRTGRATYLEVLLTQKNALDAKLEMVDAKRRQYFAFGNIYKALGGGWQ